MNCITDHISFFDLNCRRFNYFTMFMVCLLIDIGKIYYCYYHKVYENKGHLESGNLFFLNASASHSVFDVLLIKAEFAVFKFFFLL